MKDRSVSVSFVTQELTPDKAGKLFELQNQAGYIAIKAETFLDEETKALEAIKADVSEFGGKTPSQRLRNVLYVYFEQLREQGIVTNDFDLFYKKQMDVLIEQYKTKLVWYARRSSSFLQ